METKHLEVAKILISEPSLDVNDAVAFGGPALHAAIAMQLPEVVEWLCKRKDTNVNMARRIKAPMTPLMMAAAHLNPEIARILLNHPQIDTGIKTSRGDTALGVAKAKGATEIAQMIEAHNHTHRTGFCGWIWKLL
jgi:ankyrin repeat protein